MRLFLLLGGNLGDRQATLKQAQMRLEEQVGELIAASSLYETAAWGVTDQPPYLNQVLEFKTELAPLAVLDQTQAIEQELGRVRRERWGARTLDIDLLYYDNLILQSDRLTLPHPLLPDRRFVLVPLCEVAPDFLHPILQKRNWEILHDCQDTGTVSAFHTDGE
jgi:2-amino-4-hydroxy-6-hydroxymethyldihydropteridine diphosphokinase